MSFHLPAERTHGASSEQPAFSSFAGAGEGFSAALGDAVVVATDPEVVPLAHAASVKETMAIAAISARGGSGDIRAPLSLRGHRAGRTLDTIERMTIQRMDHVGIVVDDIDAATAFFTALGFEVEGTASVGGDWVDRIIGLEGVRSKIAMLRTPDGHSQVELSQFESPSVQGEMGLPSNTRGIRHLAFIVDDVDAAVATVRDEGFDLIGNLEQYENSYRLCYVRGPEGIIVELAQALG